MVKVRILITLIIFIAAVSLSVGVRIIILKDKQVFITKDMELEIKSKLEDVARLLGFSPDERPARYGLIFHITDFKKDSATFKKVLFIRDDKYGDYVYFAGSYYKAYHTLYMYDYKRRMFVPNKYGNYVKILNYAWARDESEKYIYFTGFYRKVAKYVKDEKYWLYASVTCIDFKTSFILFQKSYVFTGHSYKELLDNMRIDIKKEKFYSEKPTIAFYEGSLSLLGSFVKKYFYQEERYTMYDRSYLNYLFKEMKYQDLIGGGEEVGSYLKPARYLLVVKILNAEYKLVESTEYIEFPNPVNGGYLGRIPVYVGDYYKRDLKTGRYVPDREKGSYVKVKKGIWSKQDEYIFASSFNDLFIEDVLFHSYFIDAVVMVIDGETGNLKVAKEFSVYLKSPRSIRKDKFGSTAGEYKEDVIKEAYDRLGKELSDYVRQFFAVEAEVSEVKGNMVTISAGKNYGVKRGYYFRVIDEGYTQGYVKIADVSEKSSISRIVRFLKEDSKIRVGNKVIEDFDYKPFFGVNVSINLNPEELYMEFGYTNRDIYANKKFSFGMILGGTIDEYLIGGYVRWYMLFNRSFAVAPKVLLSIVIPYEDSEENDQRTSNSREFYTPAFKAGLEFDYPFCETVFKPHLSGVSGYIYVKYPTGFGVDIGVFYDF